MDNATLPQAEKAFGNSNTGEGTCAMDNQDPASPKPAIAEDLSIAQLAKFQTQNIQRFQEILEKLLADCESVTDQEAKEGAQQMIAKLKEIRLSIRLLESIKNSRQRAVSRHPDLEMDEEAEETFVSCMESFLLALNGFIREELFPEDHSWAEQVTSRIAVEFDDAFKPFITTSSKKEN